MKKNVSALLLVCSLLLFSGCSAPDSIQLDLRQGFANQMKLLHLNGSTSERRARIEGFEALLQDAQPLGKDLSLFAYYPDFILQITRDGQTSAAVVDINGEFVDFHYLEDDVIYRSAYGSKDLKKLVYQYS